MIASGASYLGGDRPRPMAGSRKTDATGWVQSVEEWQVVVWSVEQLPSRNPG